MLRFRGEEEAAGVPREEAVEGELPPVDREAVDEALDGAEKEELVARRRKNPGGSGTQHLESLALFYQRYYENIKDSLDNVYHRDMIGAFKRLQDEGYIEIITCAATHGYLPLLGRDSAIRGQLKTGVQSYSRFFNRAPRGIWLPECAYRPAYYEGSKVRPGIEYFLAELGIKVFFSETHLITGGAPVGVAAGEAIGPYGEIKRRYLIPMSKAPVPAPLTTFRAYYVSDTHRRRECDQHSGVVGYRAQQRNRPARLVGGLGLSRRFRLPRISPQRWRERAAILARDRRQSGPRQQGFLSPRLGRTQGPDARAGFRRAGRAHFAGAVGYRRGLRHYRLQLRHRAVRPLVVRGRGMAQAGAAAAGRTAPTWI